MSIHFMAKPTPVSIPVPTISPTAHTHLLSLLSVTMFHYFCRTLLHYSLHHVSAGQMSRHQWMSDIFLNTLFSNTLSLVCTTRCMLGHTFPPGQRPGCTPNIAHAVHPSVTLPVAHAELVTCAVLPVLVTVPVTTCFPEPSVSTKTHQWENFTYHRGVQGPLQCYQPAVHTGRCSATNLQCILT
jgi:hypothetical protein